MDRQNKLFCYRQLIFEGGVNKMVVFVAIPKAAPKPPKHMRVCTGEYLHKIVMDSTVSCRLNNVGSFYIMPRGDNNGVGKYAVKFYDNDQSMYTSTNTFLSRGKPLKAIATNPRTLLIITWSGELFFVIGSKDWYTLKKTTPDRNTKTLSKLRGYLEDSPAQTSIEESGLSQLRHAGDFDFTLVCNGKEIILVHAIVLSTFWPFFKNMMDSNMIESTNRTLHLPYPKDTVESLVSFFYGDLKSMSFATAANLVAISQVYCVTELVVMCYERIKNETLDIRKALLGWRCALEAKYDPLREYFAEFILTELAVLTDSRLSLRELSYDELLELFNDISVLSRYKKVSK